MTEWREIALGELVEIYDGPHATPKKTTSGPVFLGISNIENGRLNLTQTNHLSEIDFKRWTRRVTPRKDDIVFSYETRLGEAALIPPTLRCCLGRRMGLLRPKTDNIDARFLLYAFLGTQFQETLRSRTVHGSTVDRILLTEMGGFPIEIPINIDGQRAIAHILGTLDDKIELNRRMNETLEEMARALFKSWFVDFDPVRAKMEGRDTGLSPDVADLFPDRLVESELGEIPEGWEVGCFGSIISPVRNRVGEREAVVLSAISSGELIKSEEYFTKQVYSKSIANYLTVEQWDIAYNPSRINIGSIGMLKDPFLGAVSPVYVVIRPQPAYRWYLEFMLQLYQVKEWISTLASGSVRQSLPCQDFMSIPCVIPPHPIIQKFDEEWEHLHRTSMVRTSESRTLSSLRDTLLPKLISGEMRVNTWDEESEAIGKYR